MKKKSIFTFISCILLSAQFALTSCDRAVPENQDPEEEASSGEETSLKEMYDELTLMAEQYPELADEILKLRDNLMDNAKNVYEEETGENASVVGLLWDIASVNSKIKSDTLRYTSKDGNGNDITISGVVHYMPNLKSKLLASTAIKGVIINCHATKPQTISIKELDEKLEKAGKGTNGMLTLIDKLYSVNFLAPAGFAVFEPDYIGFGCTSDKLQTYLCQKLIAKNCADMIEPALEYLKTVKGEKNIVANCPTYIVGYSQGGGQALALTRELTLNRPGLLKKINLKYSFCGAGPYDPEATFQYWLDIDHIGLSVLLPRVLAGYKAGHTADMEGVNIKDFFIPSYNETLIPDNVLNVCGNPFFDGIFYDIDNMDDGAGTCLPGLLCHPVPLGKILIDNIRDDSIPMIQKLHHCLTDEIVYNEWTPATAICLYSEKADNIVPPINTEKAYNALHEVAPEKINAIYSDGNDHVTGQIKFMLTISDMFKEGTFTPATEL